MSTLPPPPPPGAAPLPTGYPVTFDFDRPTRIARWRPLVHWVLVIPHLVVLYLIGIVAGFVVVIAWFCGVFAGRIPEGLQTVIAMYLRYSDRVTTYMLFMREEYPPFTFAATFADPGDDPRVRMDVVPALGRRSRLTIFFRYFMLLPHAFLLVFIGIAVYFVMIVGWFAVIILGRWPEGLMTFLVGFLRWSTRFNAYAYLLTDEYPPFSFD